MRVIAGILGWLAFITLLSCDKSDWFERRCGDCTAEEPSHADIEVLMSSFHNSGKTPLISIYEGNLEDSILLYSFNTSSTNWVHKMLINKKYTFVARYFVSSKYFEVINAVQPSVRFEKFMCVSPCFRITDNLCDLRLKYQ